MGVEGWCLPLLHRDGLAASILQAGGSWDGGGDRMKMRMGMRMGWDGSGRIGGTSEPLQPHRHRPPAREKGRSPSRRKGDGHLSKPLWWEGSRAPWTPHARERVLPDTAPVERGCISHQTVTSFLLVWVHERVVLLRFPPQQSQGMMVPGRPMAPAGGPHVSTPMSTRGSLPTDPGVGKRVALGTLSQPKADACGHRSERWCLQGRGRFANTTQDVN